MIRLRASARRWRRSSSRISLRDTTMRRDSSSMLESHEQELLVEVGGGLARVAELHQRARAERGDAVEADVEAPLVPADDLARDRQLLGERGGDALVDQLQAGSGGARGHGVDRELPAQAAHLHWSLRPRSRARPRPRRPPPPARRWRPEGARRFRARALGRCGRSTRRPRARPRTESRSGRRSRRARARARTARSRFRTPAGPASGRPRWKIRRTSADSGAGAVTSSSPAVLRSVASSLIVPVP